MDIRVEQEYLYYDESSYLYAYTLRDETDEELFKRMNAYLKRKYVYDCWYDDNKEAIEEELRVRKGKKEAAEETRKEKEKKRLEKEKKELEKRLKALEITLK